MSTRYSKHKEVTISATVNSCISCTKDNGENYDEMELITENNQTIIGIWEEKYQEGLYIETECSVTVTGSWGTNNGNRVINITKISINHYKETDYPPVSNVMQLHPEVESPTLNQSRPHMEVYEAQVESISVESNTDVVVVSIVLVNVYGQEINGLCKETAIHIQLDDTGQYVFIVGYWDDNDKRQNFTILSMFPVDELHIKKLDKISKQSEKIHCQHKRNDHSINQSKPDSNLKKLARFIGKIKCLALQNWLTQLFLVDENKQVVAEMEYYHSQYDHEGSALELGLKSADNLRYLTGYPRFANKTGDVLLVTALLFPIAATLLRAVIKIKDKPNRKLSQKEIQLLKVYDYFHTLKNCTHEDLKSLSILLPLDCSYTIRSKTALEQEMFKLIKTAVNDEVYNQNNEFMSGKEDSNESPTPPNVITH